MKVRNKTLLLIASFVWMIAGFNIVRIGIIAYEKNLSIFNLCCSVLIFSIFWFFIFKRLVKKHTKRIENYVVEGQYFWKFFDLKSFVMMALMMTLGICMRVFNLIPDISVAVFYTGLGFALYLAGVSFGINYIKYSD